MKIFGKRRKRTSTDGTTINAETQDEKGDTNSIQKEDEVDKLPLKNETDPVAGEGAEEVRSYFSPDFFSSTAPASAASKQKQKPTDIQEILAMDPSTLTSKQRRLVRRHEERSGSSTTIKKQEVVDNNEEQAFSSAALDKTVSPSKTKQNTSTAILQEEGDKKRSSISTNNDADIQGKIVNKEQEDIVIKNKEKNERKLSANTSIEPQAITTTSSNTEEALKKLTEKHDENSQEPKTGKNERDVTTTVVNSTNDKEETKSKTGAEQSLKTEITITPNTACGMMVSTSSDNVLDQLKNLNSKERRKLLRKLALESKVDDIGGGGGDNDITTASNDAAAAAAKLVILAAEESNRIAEKNRAVEKEKTDLQKKEKKRKREDGDGIAEVDASGKEKNNEAGKSTDPKAKKKKTKMKDLSHLPPEERARREEQRKMQQEAAERRQAGEVLTRHPLNSERRRANRRKPGRAGKIALLKKETKEKLEGMRSYNAGGYTMRHHAKDNP